MTNPAFRSKDYVKPPGIGWFRNRPGVNYANSPIDPAREGSCYSSFYGGSEPVNRNFDYAFHNYTYGQGKKLSDKILAQIAKEDMEAHYAELQSKNRIPKSSRRRKRRKTTRY